ncbi:MAG: ArnT family glycosyltransferase, partial [Thermoanaerobaculia bacterium]
MPLSKHQRAILACVAILCAATRFLAMARSLWDWDEALFLLGMRNYDVTLHHPHPPGFPVYIALGKLVRLVTDSDFRALQTINLVAGMLVFPAMYLFARELRLRFTTSVIAAALFAFFPNVWFFGGGAFSDVPSIVLVLFAITFLLRGAENRNAYWLGTLLLALAIGIRPQNLLLGLFPGLYATRKRRPHEVVIALLIGVIVVGVAFGGAIYATGSFDDYMTAVEQHGDYISRIDSWRSPDRPPMWRLADRFFIKQYQSPVLSVIASIFVIVSIVSSVRERNRSMLMNALTFAPFAIFAWMMLDRFSISRFSIGYQPMFAV